MSAPGRDARAQLRAELEARLALLSPGSERSPARRSAIVRRAGERSFPLSFQQELLWLLDRTTPGLHVYNVMRTARLQGPLDTSALQRALDAVVERHEVLRTTYELVAGEPCQVVQPPRPVPILWLAVPGDELDERLAEATDLVGALIRRPFDLGCDLQLRVTMLELGGDDRVMLLESHHIAADAWSRHILLDEIGRYYAGYRSGTAIELPPLRVQYGDFAAWQRETFAGPALETAIGYWRERLRGVPAAIELPTDRPYPALADFGGETRDIQFDAELLAGLHGVARAQRATLFMTLLAAFGVLLGRYAGQDDIVVGSPIAGRGRDEVDGLIGYFANTLVLRVALAGDPTFDELLGRVREAALAAYEHQEVPYEKLILELAPPSVNGRSPLVQVMFTLQAEEVGQLRLAGTTLVPFGSGRDASKFDLALFMRERAGGLAAQLQFRTQVFEPATIDRILANFGALLASVVRDPACRLSQLSGLSSAERALLVGRNATAAAYPAVATLDELIAAQTARTPDARAVEWVDEHGTVTGLSYADLETRAGALAAHLQSLGVGPEVGVAICVPRSPELIVGMLGILKAGGYYVPLDADSPHERLSWMLRDAAVPVVLTLERSLRNVLSAATDGPTIVALDRDWPQIEATARRGADAEARRATPEQLAYVIYTSGSTGRPKGVMIPHRAVVNYLTWMKEAYPLQPGEGVLQKAPASFDASVWELFLPLVAGARLVLAPAGSQADAFEILTTLSRHAITIAQFVPSQLQMILESTGTRGASILGVLRRLFLGGERLPGELLDRLFVVCPRLAVTNLYGPTEATVYATHWQTDAATWRTGATVSLGRPIANVGVYVLDAGGGELVPVGVAGELCIGGVGLARGYLNLAELTAERFIADRVSGAAGGRLYRTGDLARFRADGTLEYLGRSDTQVKLRGFRVELGEIESALAAQPEVQSAVVLVRADDGDERLVAYCIPTAGAGDPVELAGMLRVRLRNTLPEYMIPAALCWLETWPLNANGKLDRAELAKREVAALPASSAFVAARTPTEERLEQIWAQVMRRDRLGMTDNFFDLGGHSILAMRIVSRVQAAFGVPVPLATMFDRPTVAEMARFVDEAGRAPSAPVPPALTRVPRASLRRPVRAVSGVPPPS